MTSVTSVYGLKFQSIFLIITVMWRMGGCIRDYTIQPNGKGCQVVQAVIERIEKSQIFVKHNFILNRIAFVFEFGKSTKYVSSATVEVKGCFFITQAMFEHSLDVAENNQDINKKILEVFCVDWLMMSYDKMSIPIFSGIAIMLLIMENGEPPMRSMIETQATLVEKLYIELASIYNRYIQLSKEFDLNMIGEKCMQCKPRGTDILFVYDASGSISESDWKYQKDFMVQFAKMQDLGPGQDQTRMTFIVFGSEARTTKWTTIADYAEGAFCNGDYFKAVKEAIRGHKRYPREPTYTNLAIERARKMYKKGAQIGIRIADSSVNQIMIVLTDGECTKEKKKDMDKQLKLLKKEFPQVHTYAIGTKKDANLPELIEIAGSEERARKYATVSQFKSDVLSLVQETCKSVAYIPQSTTTSLQQSKSGRKRRSSGKFQFKLSASSSKVGKWQYYTMSYSMNSVFSFKFTSKRFEVRVYFSFSMIVPTAQFNDFSAVVKPKKRSAVMLKPPNGFLDGICSDVPTPAPPAVATTTTQPDFDFQKTTTRKKKTTTTKPRQTPPPTTPRPPSLDWGVHITVSIYIVWWGDVVKPKTNPTTTTEKPTTRRSTTKRWTVGSSTGQDSGVDTTTTTTTTTTTPEPTTKAAQPTTTTTTTTKPNTTPNGGASWSSASSESGGGAGGGGGQTSKGSDSSGDSGSGNKADDDDDDDDDGSGGDNIKSTTPEIDLDDNGAASSLDENGGGGSVPDCAKEDTECLNVKNQTDSIDNTVQEKEDTIDNMNLDYDTNGIFAPQALNSGINQAARFAHTTVVKPLQKFISATIFILVASVRSCNQ